MYISAATSYSYFKEETQRLMSVWTCTGTICRNGQRRVATPSQKLPRDSDFLQNAKVFLFTKTFNSSTTCAVSDFHQIHDTRPEIRK